MIRYLKQYKFLLFFTVLFTAISSLSYVFIAILLQQVMDIVDMGDMDGFIRILLFSLAYFAFMGVFMYLQSFYFCFPLGIVHGFPLIRLDHGKTVFPA